MLLLGIAADMNEGAPNIAEKFKIKEEIHMNEGLAPIALFTYNRPSHTEKTIEALKKNKLARDSVLYIFSDAAKSSKDMENVDEVRKILSNIRGFKKIHLIFQEKNKGLAQSIIDGVSQVLQSYNRVIVLEDDLLTSNVFIEFMNDALNMYSSQRKVWSISGYQPPITLPEDYYESVYLSYRGSSWGWAIWKDRWDTVNWDVESYKKVFLNPIAFRKLSRGGNNLIKMLLDCIQGKNFSWAVRSCCTQAMQDKYTIYPVKSLVSSIGADGSGTNFVQQENRYDTVVEDDFQYELKKDINENKEIITTFKRFFDVSITRHIRRKFRHE